MRWGVGAGASRLVSGTMTIHRRLEQRLAAFEGSEACVLFGSGYLANLGVIGALAGRGDTVFSDELNHASIVDGCRSREREVIVYRHLDIEHLDWQPAPSRRRRPPADRHRLGVLDGRRPRAAGGDRRARQEHGARMIVDEAHATGALGPGGRGAVAQAGLEGEVDVRRRHARQGARLLRRLRVRERGDGAIPGQHRARADLLDRAPAPRDRGRARRARAAAGAPASRAAAALATRAYCAAR